MSDIFVSYASEDRGRVKPLVDALEQRGWTVWWDRTISAGQRWDRVIEAELKVAKCVLVVWTQKSIQSEWVVNEAAEARRRSVMIPALLDNVEIPLEFKRLQTASLVEWSGDLSSAGFTELAHAVSRFLSSVERAPAEELDPAKQILPARPGAPDKPRPFRWFRTPRTRRTLARFGALALAAIAGYAFCYFTHRDVLWNTGGARTTVGCAGGMIGNESALPEGGATDVAARAISPGLYISTKVLPAGVYKYFKIHLKEAKSWRSI